MESENKMKKILDYILHPEKGIVYLNNNTFLGKIFSDEFYLKNLYKLRAGKKLDLSHPTELNAKFQWYKLKYRNPLMTKCADKVRVREYVKECGFAYLLNEQYVVCDSVEDINFNKLPDVFYIKCNHSSGANMLIKKSELTNEKKIELKEYFEKALNKNYYIQNREWAYKDISPQIICERYLKSETPLVDLNFFCFNGKFKMLYYNIGLADDLGRHSVGHRAVLDQNLNIIDNAYTQMERLVREKVSLPSNIQELINCAETLSKPFPHARVDFFITSEGTYFGEITFYSASGFMYLKPDELYDELGKCFVI